MSEVGCWMLDVGWRMLDVGCRMLEVALVTEDRPEKVQTGIRFLELENT